MTVVGAASPRLEGPVIVTGSEVPVTAGEHGSLALNWGQSSEAVDPEPVRDLSRIEAGWRREMSGQKVEEFAACSWEVRLVAAVNAVQCTFLPRPEARATVAIERRDETQETTGAQVGLEDVD